jgi:predicted permease
LARLHWKRSPAAIGAALGVTVATVAFLFGENTSAGLLGAAWLGAAVALGFSGVQFLGDWVSRQTRSNRTNS